MKILIVDDDPGQREKLSTLLAPLGTCDQAGDGEAAVALFEASLEEKAPYHVVCMDIEMPRMDGHEALYAIRTLEKEWAVPGKGMAVAIMITARNSTEDILDSFHGSCQGYVNKPVVADDLIHRIREHIPKRSEATRDNLPRRIPPDYAASRRLVLEEPERLEIQMSNLVKRFAKKWSGRPIRPLPILEEKKQVGNDFTRTLDAALLKGADETLQEEGEALWLGGVYEFVGGNVLLKLTLTSGSDRLLDGVRVPLKALWTRTRTGFGG
ncbi:MAG: response regulator [Magnetococcales bacterium]|nr:response regulator [Magnetococcales bacterium]